MQTGFSIHQLADPRLAEAEKILRSCVHCGFCTATCPTYVTLGDELDSPRGRIYLIKEMLENDRPGDPETALHIDRCLSCLSCMTTCPSGVDYMHLVDHARTHIEKTWRRPFLDRQIRNALAWILPYPARFRAAFGLARFSRPLAGLFERIVPLRPLAAMLRLAPASLPPRRSGASTAAVVAGKRVTLLAGCAQSVLDPVINEAASALLARLGVTVIEAPGEGCCGALAHHMGREAQALDHARRNVEAWTRLIDEQGLDAILITTSGCGTTVKDYGHMLRFDERYAARAAAVSARAFDITEYLAGLDLPPPVREPGLTVAYHSACSLQHGQKVTSQPVQLLRKAGFIVREPAEGHLCCGSAGTYNILQSGIAASLGRRKAGNLEATRADLIAAGNIGCLTQIGSHTTIPAVHTIKLLDWAWGGSPPEEARALTGSGSFPATNSHHAQRTMTVAPTGTRA